MIQKVNKPGLFCISFDSVAMSGIIVEFLKVAKVFYANDYLVYLDLGYEIKADKGNFFRPYSNEYLLYPHWVNLVKTIENKFFQYSAELVEKLLKFITNDSDEINRCNVQIENYSDYIADQFINLWSNYNIKVVIVENGTLPENIIFTKALYKAIDRYGKIHKLDKYVLWRDHDLMWSSETNIGKYGSLPYLNTPKIKPSKYITHVVLHDADYYEMKKWNPDIRIKILNNEFRSMQEIAKHNEMHIEMIKNKFRSEFSIPENAYFLARFTRIIPQKRIDRDIDLLYQLHKKSKLKNIYLGIAGNIDENQVEFFRLKNIVDKLGLNKYVIFLGELRPIISNFDLKRTSIMDLIIASDLCCFMTSYDYESYGNPIAESICFNKPYITTQYKRYNHVYGNFGYIGLVFPISENDDGLVDDNFVSEVYALLKDNDRIKMIVNHNKKIMQEKQISDVNLPEKLNSFLSLSLKDIFFAK